MMKKVVLIGSTLVAIVLSGCDSKGGKTEEEWIAYYKEHRKEFGEMRMECLRMPDAEFKKDIRCQAAYKLPAPRHNWGSAAKQD